MASKKHQIFRKWKWNSYQKTKREQIQARSQEFAIGGSCFEGVEPNWNSLHLEFGEVPNKKEGLYLDLDCVDAQN